MIYKTDYHIHTTYSDGRAAPGEYLPAACAAGLSEIGFSEHFSIFPADTKLYCLPEDIKEYFEKINELKSTQADLIIRKGLEVDFAIGHEKETELILESLDLDYRIGSVHFLDNNSDVMDPGFYKGKDPDLLFSNYFYLITEAASSGLFDIIAHCDLIRIFGIKPSFNPESLYRRLAREMRKHDVAFEVNTNGKNRPMADFYPDSNFLHIFREENVAVCVNSDSHIPARVGQYFDEAYLLLRRAGFNEMVTFTSRNKKMVPFRL